jgi:lysophospholipase L1-like esterase
MKKIFLFALIIYSFSAFAQYPSPVFTKPNNSYGTILNGFSPDSVFYFPTGCGVPTDTTFLHAQQNGGKAQKLRKWAIYGDTCGHNSYLWEPTLQIWFLIKTKGVDSIFRTPGIDSICYILNGRQHCFLDSAGGGGGGIDSTLLTGLWIKRNSVGTIITIYADSAAMASYFLRRADSGTNYVTAAQLGKKLDTSVHFNIYVRRLGAPGDTLLTASDSTLHVAAQRDSIDAHHVINPDLSWTWYVQAHDSTSANALETEYGADTARLAVNAALANKVTNGGASKSFTTGLLSSRPAASNCQCYYGSTTDSVLYYDNGAWIPMGRAGSGSSLLLNNLLSINGGIGQLGGTSAKPNTTLGFHNTDTLTYDSLKNLIIRGMPLLTSSAGAYVVVRDSITGKLYDIPAQQTDTTGVAAGIAAGNLMIAVWNGVTNKVVFQALPLGPFIVNNNWVVASNVLDSVCINCKVAQAPLTDSGTFALNGFLGGTNTVTTNHDSTQTRYIVVNYQGSAKIANQLDVTLNQGATTDTTSMNVIDINLHDNNQSKHASINGINFNIRKQTVGGTLENFTGINISLVPSAGDSLGGLNSIFHPNIFNPSGYVGTIAAFDAGFPAGSYSNINKIIGLNFGSGGTATAQNGIIGVNVGVSAAANNYGINSFGTANNLMNGPLILNNVLGSSGTPKLLVHASDSSAKEIKLGSGFSVSNDTLNVTGGGGGSTLPLKAIGFGNASNTLTGDTTKIKFDSSGQGHTYLYVNNGPVATGDISGFGNSITFGLNANPQNVNDWIAQLAYNLGTTPNNLGLSSSTLEKQTPLNPFGAANAIDRVAGTIPTKDATHRLLVIMYGINDVRYNGANYTTTNFALDYDTVLTSIYAKGWDSTTVIMTSTTYVDSASAFVSFSGNPIATYARQASFDSTIQARAAFHHVKYVDVKTPMILAGKKDVLSSDGLHPSNAGHRIIALAIAKALDSARIDTNYRFIVNGNAKFDGIIRYRNMPVLAESSMPLHFDSVGNLGYSINENIFGKALIGGAINSDTANLIVSGQILADGLKLAANVSYPNPTTGNGLWFNRFPTTQDYRINNEDWSTLTPHGIAINDGGGPVTVGGTTFDPNGSKLFVPTTGINTGNMYITGFNPPSVGTGMEIGWNGTNGYIYCSQIGVAAKPLILGYGGSPTLIGGTGDDGVNGFQVNRTLSRFYGTVGINTNAVAQAHLKLAAGTTLIAPLKFDTTGNVLTTVPKPFNLEMLADSLYFTGYSGTRYKVYPQSSSGVTAVGAFSGSSQTNGASISGSTITFGPADATNPGMVTTGAQTFAGVKTHSNTIISSGGFYNSVPGAQFAGQASTINNAITAASGTVSNFSNYAFLAPTVTSTNTGVVYNNPATLRINNAPTMGTNSSSTGFLYALDVAAGLSHFGLGSSSISAIFDGSVSLGTSGNGSYFVNVGASTSSITAMNLSPGVNPSSATVSGDLWYNGTNLYFGDGGGVKRDLLAPATALKAEAYISSQTATNNNFTTYATPASDGMYEIGGYVNVSSVTVDVLQLQVSYTDETNTSRTVSFVNQGATSANITATGPSQFPPMRIRVKASTTINISAVLTTGTGSINYNAEGAITLIK